MKYVITNIGDVENGVVVGPFPTLEEAEASAEVGKEDPVFGSARSLEEFYDKADLLKLAARYEIPQQQLRLVETKHEIAMLVWRVMSGEEVMASEKARRTPRPKTSGATGGMRSRLEKDAIIHMGADDKGNPYGAKNNPKREGSASHERFAKYKEGISIQTALAAGITPADLHHDEGKGFIKIERKSST